MFLIGTLLSQAGGAPALAATDSAANQGVWSPVEQWPVVAIHATLLPNGKVLSWGRGNPDGVASDADLWDPLNNSHALLRNAVTDVFCAGHTLLGDGRLLVAGGHLPDQGGAINANIFDYRTSQWSAVPDMNAGRWYPTVLTLTNGDGLVVAGHDANFQNNTLPQIFRKNNSWRNLNTANRPLLLYYPRMFLAPNGKVFMLNMSSSTDGVRPGEATSGYLTTSGTGAWQDVETGQPWRGYGTAVIYQPGKLLVAGGSGSNAAYTINLNVGPLGTATNPMYSGRMQHNAVILPTGEVLIIGGHSQNVSLTDSQQFPVFFAESWNPATGQWTKRASQKIPRLYHSTALLLPDGRVISAGGGANGTITPQFNAEFYTPWYLFQANGMPASRPQLTSAPAVLYYGASFQIKTPTPDSIARATLLRLGSTTHAYDANERFYEFTITRRTSTALVMTLPNAPKILPPGHYLLFVIDGAGVPSVGKIVRIGPAGTPALAANAEGESIPTDEPIDLAEQADELAEPLDETSPSLLEDAMPTDELMAEQPAPVEEATALPRLFLPLIQSE